MKDFFKNLLPKIRPYKTKDSNDEIKRQITSLYNIFSGLIGSEKVILKACKLDALELMRSEAVPERVLVLKNWCLMIQQKTKFLHSLKFRKY